MTTTYFSSEFHYIEFCIAADSKRVSELQHWLDTAKLAPRKRAKIQAIVADYHARIERHEADRAVMIAENFDVIRRTMLGEYEIVALEPTKPCLRESVSAVKSDWLAVPRQGKDLSGHRWRNVIAGTPVEFEVRMAA